MYLKVNNASDDRDTEPAVTAQQEAYCYIRRQILAGEFGPGHRINLAEVAETLSLSRMPVRDALRQLDAEGMVVMRPNRGATVVNLTSAQADEYLEIRAVLEGLAARIAAQRMTAEDVEQLTFAQQQLKRAENDRVLWLQRHRQFQSLVHQISGLPNLAREILRVSDLMAPFVASYIARMTLQELPDPSHDELLRALCSGDPDHAETTMREHILVGGRTMTVRMQESERGSVERQPSAPHIMIC